MVKIAALGCGAPGCARPALLCGSPHSRAAYSLTGGTGTPQVAREHQSGDAAQTSWRLARGTHQGPAVDTVLPNALTGTLQTWMF